MFRYRRTRGRALILWFCVLVGGVLLGAAAVLWLELQLVHEVREEVAELSGVERWLGGVLFHWRAVDEQLALAVSEIPEEHLRWTEHAVKVLVACGLGLCVLLPTLLRWRWR